MSKFYYSGAADDSSSAGVVCINENCYITYYVEVAVFYGEYLRSDSLTAQPPSFLPPLPDVRFSAMVYHASGENPTTKDSVPTLINRQDIYDIEDPRNCLGTKFTFATRILQDDCAEYVLMWSTGAIEVPYGIDTLVIKGVSGREEFSPCTEP